MCENSIYAAHRKATNREELVTQMIPDTGHVGLYPSEGHGPLVCTQHGQQLVIDEVRLRGNAVGLKDVSTNGPAQFTPEKWQGQKNVTVICVGWGQRSHQYRGNGDALEFPDGVRVHLSYFKTGVRASIGRPVERDLEKAMGLDQLRAEPAVEPVKEKPRKSVMGLAAWLNNT